MNGSLKTCLPLQAMARAPQNESESTAHCAPPAHRVPLIPSNPVLSPRARRSPAAPRLSPRSNAPLALSTTTPGKPGSLPLPRHPHFCTYACSHSPKATSQHAGAFKTPRWFAGALSRGRRAGSRGEPSRVSAELGRTMPLYPLLTPARSPPRCRWAGLAVVLSR